MSSFEKAMKKAIKESKKDAQEKEEIEKAIKESEKDAQEKKENEELELVLMQSQEEKLQEDELQEVIEISKRENDLLKLRAKMQRKNKKLNEGQPLDESKSTLFNFRLNTQSEEEKTEDEIIPQEDLIYQDVDKNGNCLFASINIGLSDLGIIKTIEDLREESVNNLTNNSIDRIMSSNDLSLSVNVGKEIIEGEEISLRNEINISSFEQYQELMKQNQTYGTNEEIEALAFLYGVSIKVWCRFYQSYYLLFHFNPGNPIVNIIADTMNDDNCINKNFCVNNHFAYLRPQLGGEMKKIKINYL